MGTGNTSTITSNLSQVVANEYTNPDGYTYSYHYMRGSQTGITVNLEPGAYAVYEPINNTKNTDIQIATNPSTTTYSGDCVNTKGTITSAAGSGNVYGYGTIKAGESKTCIVTNALLRK
jgi:ribosomal protein S8E